MFYFILFTPTNLLRVYYITYLLAYIVHITCMHIQVYDPNYRIDFKDQSKLLLRILTLVLGLHLKSFAMA